MTTMEDVVGLKAAADSAFKGKDWMEASECYTAAIDARKAVPDTVADTEVPQLFVLYNNRSASYRNARFASLAAKDAESSLSLESGAKNVRGHQRLGNALRTLGELKEAQTAYQKCLDLGDSSVQEVMRDCVGFAGAREQMVAPSLKALAATTNMKQNKEDPYGSGDQSDCPGLPQSEQPHGLAHQLRNAWAEGHDFNPLQEYSAHSDFMYHCFVGNVKEVKFLIDLVKEDDGALRKLVNKRESINRLSPLMGAIGGTRKGAPRECGDGKGNLEVCKLLLLNGADVNAKDVAGYSVVHHATTGYATELTLEILPILYARKANFTVFNRFGDGPLGEPIMAGNQATVRALLQFGADPAKASKSGRINLTMLAMGKPAIIKLLQTAQGFCGLKKGDSVLLQPSLKVKVPNSRNSITVDRGVVDNWSVGEYRVGITVPDSEDLVYVNVKCENLLGEKKSDSACAQCGKSGATQQCSKCKVPKYCDAACQKAHWKGGHKKECKEASEWTVSPPPLKDAMRWQADATKPLGRDGKPQVIDSHEAIKKLAGKSIQDLIVKIQVPMAQGGPGVPRPGGPLLIYNQGQMINWYISPEDCPCYNDICDHVRANGLMGGAKQYYRAELVNGDLKIVKTGLGAQNW